MKEKPLAKTLAAALRNESESTSRGVRYSTAKMSAKHLEEQYAANKEWHDKTEWLRKDLQPHELGKHLADVLRERLEHKDAILNSPLSCDICGAVCDNPWHYSTAEDRHKHACDKCWEAFDAT